MTQSMNQYTFMFFLLSDLHNRREEEKPPFYERNSTVNFYAVNLTWFAQHGIVWTCRHPMCTMGLWDRMDRGTARTCRHPVGSHVYPWSEELSIFIHGWLPNIPIPGISGYPKVQADSRWQYWTTLAHRPQCRCDHQLSWRHACMKHNII